MQLFNLSAHELLFLVTVDIGYVHVLIIVVCNPMYASMKPEYIKCNVLKTCLVRVILENPSPKAEYSTWWQRKETNTQSSLHLKCKFEY